MRHQRPAAAGPWVIGTRELGRRPGAMRTVHRTIPAPGRSERIGLEVVAVPEGAPVELDVRLESVTEGVYVSGTVSAPLTGECSRCLDDLDERLDVEIAELFVYPDSVTDQTTDDDELPRVVAEQLDLEQTVRDAVVLALPLAPLCSPDCPGLDPQTGRRRPERGAEPEHERIDPRWAALRERLSTAETDDRRSADPG